MKDVEVLFDLALHWQLTFMEGTSLAGYNLNWRRIGDKGGRHPALNQRSDSYQVKDDVSNVSPSCYATHGGGRVLIIVMGSASEFQATPSLKQDQVDVAKVSEEVNKLMNGEPTPQDVNAMITLKDDRSIGWTKDEKWDRLTLKFEKPSAKPATERTAVKCHTDDEKKAFDAETTQDGIISRSRGTSHVVPRKWTHLARQVTLRAHGQMQLHHLSKLTDLGPVFDTATKYIATGPEPDCYELDMTLLAVSL
ncbi:hypothetical protein BYT27DRAFT_7213932 [Phlegmacium glaucopus]|nr:hypothetical protein BYT27DRAFT_7213932 [Phlegmacium glaucopus]